jgi:hypothetical protein
MELPPLPDDFRSTRIAAMLDNNMSLNVPLPLVLSISNTVTEGCRSLAEPSGNVVTKTVNNVCNTELYSAESHREL